MALLTVATVTPAGVAANYQQVNASDTISGADIGNRGVVLVVKTGGTATTVTVGDPLTTPAGNPAAGSPAGKSIAVGTDAEMRIFVGKANVDPATGVATISYSSTTGVTAQAIRY